MTTNLNKPLVSICCITFNQVPYLRQCLDGFVMQQTSFPFEIIIHDDASTDGTQEIIKEYAEKYPQLFKPILQEQNQYSKGIRSILATFCYPKASGKYIALCEGDDYWTDPLKLQKQVDFLESHPDYSMCFHEASILNETTTNFKYPTLENRNYTAEELFKTWTVPTASIVYRKNFNQPVDNRFISGDIVLVLSCAKYGEVYGIHQEMSTYRVQSGGLTISRLTDPIRFYKSEINHYKALSEYFPEIGMNSLNLKLSDSYINLGVAYLKKNNLRGILYISKSFGLSPSNFYKRVGNLFKK